MSENLPDPTTAAAVISAAVHGRGVLGRCKDDEPVFVIVARDPAAAETIRYWQRLRMIGHHLQVDREKVEGAERVRNAMSQWRYVNPPTPKSHVHSFTRCTGSSAIDAMSIEVCECGQVKIGQ